MPNRIIKESIRTSDTIEELNWEEECFFYRLIVSADDYGIFDGRMSIIKATMFPLRNITTSQISADLSKLQDVGLIERYTVNDKPYIRIKTWDKHQRIRSKWSKYPAPDGNLLTNDSKPLSNASVIQSNPIQIQSNHQRQQNAASSAASPIGAALAAKSTKASKGGEIYHDLKRSTDGGHRGGGPV